MSTALDKFNEALKKKLETDFGKKFVNDKIIIMGLDDKPKKPTKPKE